MNNQQFYELLITLKYPVYKQGSFTKDQAYPDTFITFWNNVTDDGSHYDNFAINYVWNYTVNVYSIDPYTVEELLMSIKNLLKANGWIVPGKGNDAPSDEPTHSGRTIDAIYIEN